MENLEPATQPKADGALAAEKAAPADAAADAGEHGVGGLELLREWTDALLIAFVLAMFVRVFMVELFKIPTGSMTPTLIGGEIAEVDYNNDGKRDLIVLSGHDSNYPLYFENDGGRLVARGSVHMTWEEQETLKRSGEVHTENDRILVNKFAYWFHPPRRGDIVVFKVPEKIWKDDQQIYIKRAVGEPGERLTFDRGGRLEANGERISQPPFFARQVYEGSIKPQKDAAPPPAGQIDYEPTWNGEKKIMAMNVPHDEIFVFGDNAHSSLDSRYWGGVPLENVKGRAFFRYWPISKMGFLHSR